MWTLLAEAAREARGSLAKVILEATWEGCGFRMSGSRVQG